MNRYHWFILAFGYVSGLLLTGIFGFPNPHPSWQQWGIVIGAIVGLTLGLFLILKKRWRRCPKGQFWVLFCVVALWGVIYFQWRVPQPLSNDISQQITDNFSTQQVQVLGQVLSEPRMTNNQRQKFWLKAQRIALLNEQNRYQLVTGKVYVTIPQIKNQSLYPRQIIVVKGLLYKPRSPKNPGAFDFKNYLAKAGAFSGLKGEEIIFKGAEPSWGWTQLRQGIIETFTNRLGERKGLVISSMILGRRAVDLPPDIRDSFIKMGLAHVLAASGFHVALLLSVVFWLTRDLSPKKKLILGSIILSFYAGLTGLQPSILRATFMGIFILIGEGLDRKINSLGSLGLAGFLLLIFNPLWIWDLSFQLSFVATFGLITTSPVIQKKIDFLPSKIASMIAVPIAVSIWTSPLIMYTFYSFSFYVIPLNILVTPIITFLIIGGMIGSTITLIFPLIGGYFIQILSWPLEFLLAVGNLFSKLSLNAISVGKISLWMMLLIYGLLVLVWLNKVWQKRWLLMGFFIVSLVIIPILYNNLSLLKITILKGKYEPILVIQDRGKNTIVNLGDEATIKYTLLPFLSQQGINHIKAIVVPNTQKINPWLSLKPDLKVDQFFYGTGNATQGWQSLSVDQKITVNSVNIKLLNHHPFILQWEIGSQTWLWINSDEKFDDLSVNKIKKNLNILLWSGKKLSPTFLNKIQPQVTIISNPFLSHYLKQALNKTTTTVYWLEQNGAVQWTPNQGLQPLLRAEEPTT